MFAVETFIPTGVVALVGRVVDALLPRSAPTPPVLDFAPVAPPAPVEVPAVNPPRKAEFLENVCLRLPDGSYVSVPPYYAGGYDGVQVGAKYCQGFRDPEILGPGGGSNPVEIPPATPPATMPDAPSVIFNPRPITTPEPIPIGGTPDNSSYLDNLWFSQSPEAAGPAAPEAAAADPATTDPVPTKSCACAGHADGPGGKRNWLLLIFAAFALYKLTR